MIAAYQQAIRKVTFSEDYGMLTAVSSSLLEATGCEVRLGDMVEIEHALNKRKSAAEVIGLRDGKIQLIAEGNSTGLCLNSRVKPLNRASAVQVGYEMLGRVFDANARPLDELAPPSNTELCALDNTEINPLSRTQIDSAMQTKIKAIDTLLPLGKGQKIGIFAGSGVGKTTLLNMLVNNAEADIVIVALVGERGREVVEFVDETLHGNAQGKTIVFAATSEQPATMRKKVAVTATTTAEWFSKQGKNVLLIMDSVSRFAYAQREIGVAAGEHIGARGYPASVFNELPALIERAGAFKKRGSITAIYTILVEGDDMNEPVADHMRSILDGHIVLSRELAAAGHFPAIDVLKSVSRLTTKLLDDRQVKLTQSFRKVLSVYENAKDLVEMGASQKGNDKSIDLALQLKDEMLQFLQQNTLEKIDSQQAWSVLTNILDTAK